MECCTGCVGVVLSSREVELNININLSLTTMEIACATAGALVAEKQPKAEILEVGRECSGGGGGEISYQNQSFQ